MGSSSNWNKRQHALLYGRTTEPLCGTSNISFTDRENRAIMSLISIGDKPVIFQRSKLRKEDAVHDSIARVGSTSHAKLETQSNSSAQIGNPNFISTGRSRSKRRINHLKNSSDSKDEDGAATLLSLGKGKLDTEAGDNIAVKRNVTSFGGSTVENLNRNSRASHVKKDKSVPKQNRHGVRGRPRKSGPSIGVSDYRGGRWEANIWLKKEKRQIHLGQYFIVEAAARSSDKAMLVTRSPPDRNLNYPETDYDMKIIDEWRKIFNEDVNIFLEELRKQSRMYSEDCVKGLHDEAARQLLQLINEKKKTFLIAGKSH